MWVMVIPKAELRAEYGLGGVSAKTDAQYIERLMSFGCYGERRGVLWPVLYQRWGLGPRCYREELATQGLLALPWGYTAARRSETVAPLIPNDDYYDGTVAERVKRNILDSQQFGQDEHPIRVY